MTAILVYIMLLFSSTSANNSLFSTNFIGMNKSEIKAIVDEEYYAFKLNTTNVNDTYNYLKYEDRIREITALFFLNDNDRCRMIRIMYDYSNYTDLVEELNEQYLQNGEKAWKYMNGDKQCNVSLKEGDWFFTVSIEEQK